jgi:hypothetical protein
MSAHIIFNGKTYNSIDDMPPEARQAYEKALALLADQNANGVPDFLDGLLNDQVPGEGMEPLNTFSTFNTQIVHNGQTYASVDEMPAEARRDYEQAMAAFDRDRNGVPDAFEQGEFVAGQPSVSLTPAPGPASAPRPMPAPYTPAGVEPNNPEARAGRRRAFAFVAFIGAALLLVAAVILVIVVLAPALLGLR